jgi:hypothetical protein
MGNIRSNGNIAWDISVSQLVERACRVVLNAKGIHDERMSNGLTFELQMNTGIVLLPCDAMGGGGG